MMEMKSTHTEISHGSFSENAGEKRIFVAIGNNMVIITIEEARGFINAFTALVGDAEYANRRIQKEAKAATRKTRTTTRKKRGK